MVKPQSPIAGKHSDKIRLVQLSYIGDLHGAVYTSAAHSSMANNSRITRTMCCRSRIWTRLRRFATRYTPQTLPIIVKNTTKYFGKKPTEFSNMAINPRWRLLSKIREINYRILLCPRHLRKVSFLDSDKFSTCLKTLTRVPSLSAIFSSYRSKIPKRNSQFFKLYYRE